MPVALNDDQSALAQTVAGFAARHGATVLVLDEPTSQFDIRAEAAFYGRFLEMTQGLTTVVISHRFPTVRLADVNNSYSGPMARIITWAIDSVPDDATTSAAFHCVRRAGVRQR